jgi:hypothetical protein
MINAMGVINAA